VSDLDHQKSQLRKNLLSKRKALNPSPCNIDLFSSIAEFEAAKVIAGYWPMAGEFDIRPVLKTKKTCCLPVVDQKNGPLIFRKWQEGENLVEGPHHTKHPMETAEIVTPDLVLIPLLGFDEKGGRLGFGGGYYDRTLQKLKAIRIGVGFDEQQVDHVPMDQYDQRLDWIVTPTRVIRCEDF